MNANISQIMKRTILALVTGVGLVLLGAADTSAHDVGYKPHYVPVHYVHARTRFYPGWLNRNREFQRWYFHNQYRFKRHMSWSRLYDIYRFEKRQRRHGRRIYGKVYHDQGYRSFYPVPRKHRH